MENFREEELMEPVSPLGQCLDTTFLCVHIIGVLEFQVPIHDLQIAPFLQGSFLSIPRFTSTMVGDEKGLKRWKQVEVKLEEHLVEPEFVSGMPLDYYDKHFADYLSRVAMEKLPQGKPLWQVHVIKYPTSSAEGTLVFKFHHAIGDGYTLMGLVLSTLQRSDDPSLPLSFPLLMTSKPENSCKFFLMRIPQFLSMAFNSVSEFGWGLLKSTFVEDDKTPIRSGAKTLIEYRPTVVSNITFSIDHIKEIKSKLGVSVNDVITGIIFYGVRLYMQDIDYRSRTSKCTALVLANTRNVKDYRNVQDMLKSTEGAWGNHFTLFHVSMPTLEDTPISDPLRFVRKAHTSIKKKRNSFASLLNQKLLLLKNKFRGPEAAAKHIFGTVINSSLLITNMAGPLQQMALLNHPVRGVHFTLSGVPQSVVFTIVSYMGMLRVTTTTEEGFIDEQKLVSYLNIAFDTIRRGAAKENVPK